MAFNLSFRRSNSEYGLYWQEVVKWLQLIGLLVSNPILQLHKPVVWPWIVLIRNVRNSSLFGGIFKHYSTSKDLLIFLVVESIHLQTGSLGFKVPDSWKALAASKLCHKLLAQAGCTA
jgi:hypothetical protein